MSAHARLIARATNWLLHSEIQGSDGGVARFYRSDQVKNNPVSTEITGYHAGTLAWLYKTNGDAKLLQRATETADFLVDRAWDSDLRTFPFEYPHASPAYFFDCGIIVRGLMAVWSITKTPRYLDVAQSCARQMVHDFNAGTDFDPVLELPSKTPAARDTRWSRSPGCYQLKPALAFRELEPAAWERILQWCLNHHDRFLPGHEDEERVMDRLHAYCYFLEALLISSESATVASGIERVAHLLNQIAPAFVRSDVYAQLLRIRLYSDAAGILPLDTGAAALEAERLATFQLTSDDHRNDGGFCFGSRRGEMLPYVNPVSTDFALQAMHLWHCATAGAPLFPISELV